MSSLDEQLKALENQYRPTPPPTDLLDQHLVELQEQCRPKPSPVPPSSGEDALGAMLQNLERDTLDQRLTQSQKNAEICQAIAQLIETKREARIDMNQSIQDMKAIAKAEQEKQQRAKYWHNKATQWLKELDPISNEGLWFYEFAERCPAPLEAAMDYLMALE
jgi:acyl-CoA reductase-like NAD-dependent aldehyde dehydrogenase